MGFRLWNLSTKPGMCGIPNFQNYLEGVATYVAPKGCYNNVREGLQSIFNKSKIEI